MFVGHRQALMSKMQDAVAVFFAAPERLRNSDVHHPYRQDSDFYYLTGFEEPESVLVIAPNRDEGDQVILFVPPRNPEREVWDGERLGAERAPDTLKVDKAFSIEELTAKLPDYLIGSRRVYHALGWEPEYDQTMLKALQDARRARRNGFETPGNVLDPAPLLHELRIIKSKGEIDAMRRAAELGAAGHRRAMEATAPGRHEYDLEAEMDYLWRKSGSPRTAYPSIVGSGPNGCVLHYRANNRKMLDGDLVLVDAGAEVDYFASDITRTWPVNGTFSPAQREIYQLVLDAQIAAIDHCRAGNTFNSVHDVAVRHLVEGMCHLGLLTDDPETAIKTESYKQYYMHKTGHWIGMDVHDVGIYYQEGASRVLQPGMVLTVEPGMYISPNDKQAPEKYRGIGIRIEDDILVTEGDPDVLSKDAPKTIAEVEAAVGANVC